MKVLIALATIVLAVNALTVHEEWSQFKLKHSKSYKNIVEEKVRFEIFQNNLKKIEEHNQQYEAGLKTWYMGVNKFADMTKEEFGAMLKKQSGSRPRLAKSRHVPDLTANVPETIDWRERNAVLGVKDQGQCGSCWAFSATGSLEGQNVLKNNRSIPLSEQQLLDCSESYGNGDCSVGGDMVAAFEYVIDHGLTTEEAYPYRAEQYSCRAPSSSAVTVTDYRYVDASESALREAVGTVGPISVAMYAEPIQLYYGGIFQDRDCYNDEYYLDHGVLAVAYGTTNGQKYWTIKNSWGSDWGEAGFFRLARDEDQCGIALDSSYPILA